MGDGLCQTPGAYRGRAFSVQTALPTGAATQPEPKRPDARKRQPVAVEIMLAGIEDGWRNQEPLMSDRKSWQGERGSRQARGYGGSWDKLRLRILERDNYLCQQCLRDGIVTPLKVKPYDHAVDHIVNKAEGGTDDPANLESLCKAHHDAKSQAEAVEGRGARQRPRFDASGFPVWE